MTETISNYVIYDFAELFQQDTISGQKVVCIEKSLLSEVVVAHVRFLEALKDMTAGMTQVFPMS